MCGAREFGRGRGARARRVRIPCGSGLARRGYARDAEGVYAVATLMSSRERRFRRFRPWREAHQTRNRVHTLQAARTTSVAAAWGEGMRAAGPPNGRYRSQKRRYPPVKGVDMRTVAG